MGLKCKMVYTSDLPSNHFICLSDWEREREREIERERELELGTWSMLLPEARRRCPLNRTLVSQSHHRCLSEIVSSSTRYCRRCPLDRHTHDRSHRLCLKIIVVASRSTHPWPISASFLIYLSLSLSLSLVLPPSLSLTDFLSLMKGFVLIFISLSLYIEIFYYKICLEAEKMWETSRKIAFSACNQTL